MNFTAGRVFLILFAWSCCCSHYLLTGSLIFSSIGEFILCLQNLQSLHNLKTMLQIGRYPLSLSLPTVRAAVRAFLLNLRPGGTGRVGRVMTRPKFWPTAQKNTRRGPLAVCWTSFWPDQCSDQISGICNKVNMKGTPRMLLHWQWIERELIWKL